MQDARSAYDKAIKATDGDERGKYISQFYAILNDNPNVGIETTGENGAKTSYWGRDAAGFLIGQITRSTVAQTAQPSAAFKHSEQENIDAALKLAKAMTDATQGKNQRRCDTALNKLSNGKISSLNALVTQYITSGTGQNIFDGRKVATIGFGTDNPDVPAFVIGVGTSNALTYINSKFFNFTGLGADQAKAIVLLHEAVHHFGGMRDNDFDPRKKPEQTVGSRKITNTIIDNCYPALRETFKSLHL